MDLHRLEIFCKLIELQSFTKSAEALLLSQPTVSEHIRTLEEMVGEKLVDRLGREILPTPAGQILYRYAHKMLHIREEAIQALAAYKGDISGRLIIGASTIPGTYILPRIVGSFKASYPSCQLIVRIASTGNIVDSLLKGDFEIGLVGSKWKDRRLNFSEIFRDELVLVIYPEHPWSDRQEVAMEEIYGEPFILREKGSGTQMVVWQILEAHGFDFAKMSVVAEMASTEAVRQSVKARLGIAIISRYAVEDDLEHGSLVAVPLQGIQFSRPFYLTQRLNRQLSPLSLTFLNHLQTQGMGVESKK
jgi:DNA-binding transcriptional LysR family regulator